jgi:hypothetical protein
MQYIGASYIKPHYQMMKQFKNLFFNVQFSDSLPDSRAISFDVSSPEEISAVFDSITYDKVMKYFYCLDLLKF